MRFNPENQLCREIRCLNSTWIVIIQKMHDVDSYSSKKSKIMEVLSYVGQSTGLFGMTTTMIALRKFTRSTSSEGIWFSFFQPNARGRAKVDYYFWIQLIYLFEMYYIYRTFMESTFSF